MKKTLLCEISRAPLSWGVEGHVIGSEGEALGSVEEKVLETLFSFGTRYAVKDASGNEIATSEKITSWKTQFEIADTDGRHVATIKRTSKWGADQWSVDFAEESEVDRRLLVFVPAFKTYADNNSD